MELFQLSFDRRISVLEKENRWKTAVDIVFENWKDSPNDLNSLICAGTQLWYTLLVMDYIKNAPFPPADDFEIVTDEQLQINLMDVTRHGFKFFSDNSIFNAYFGYMISVMPYFFLDYKGDYLGWKKKGIEMICRAYSLDPENLFTKAMYYRLVDSGNNMLFVSTCNELWTRITPVQWGDSEVQQYFFRILHGE